MTERIADGLTMPEQYEECPLKYKDMPTSDLLFELGLESTQNNPQIRLSIEYELQRRKHSDLGLKSKESEPSIRKTVVRILFVVSLPFILFGIFLYLLYSSGSRDLGNGYAYSYGGRSDFHHITKNDKMFISNLVVDISTVNNYVVGIQLPRCPNTHPQKNILSIQKTYFILNIDTNSVTYFVSKNEFLHKLVKLGLFDKVSLKYEYLNNVYEHTLNNNEWFIAAGRMGWCTKELMRKLN